MISKFFSKLSENREEPLNESDTRLALAVLLVRVGRSDDEFVQEEIERVDQILSLRYDLTPEQAMELRVEAENIEKEVNDSVRFTRELKKTVPLEERVGLLEALWEVVLVDERRDYTEDGMMRLFCRLLGVNDRDNAFARQRVIAKMK